MFNVPAIKVAGPDVPVVVTVIASCLLLNMFQSAADKKPSDVPLAWVCQVGAVSFCPFDRKRMA